MFSVGKPNLHCGPTDRMKEERGLWCSPPEVAASPRPGGQPTREGLLPPVLRIKSHLPEVVDVKSKLFAMQKTQVQSS